MEEESRLEDPRGWVKIVKVANYVMYIFATIKQISEGVGRD